MNECFSNLVNLKELCADESAPQPLFFLDDIEGIDQTTLSKLASVQEKSGKMLAVNLIDSAIRQLQGDIETILPGNYNLQNKLDSFCSTCEYTGLYYPENASERGIVITKIVNSTHARLVLDSFKALIDSSGEFTIIIDDGVQKKEIEEVFIAGEMIDFKVNFITKAKSIKIYFKDPDSIKLAQIKCDSSGCGCSGGASKNTSKHIAISGLSDGQKVTEHYAFIPCVSVQCDYASIICQLVTSAPRAVGLALLYLVAAKIYAENVHTTRVNQVASHNKEKKENVADMFFTLYEQRLRGTKKIKGLSQIISNNLSTMRDECVICTSVNRIAWAVT